MKFDRVLFNAPYFNKKPDPEKPLTYGVYDFNYQATRKFLKGARKFLKRSGRVLLGYGLLDDVQLFEDIIKKSGFKISAKHIETHGHTRVLYILR